MTRRPFLLAHSEGFNAPDVLAGISGKVHRRTGPGITAYAAGGNPFEEDPDHDWDNIRAIDNLGLPAADAALDQVLAVLGLTLEGT